MQINTKEVVKTPRRNCGHINERVLKNWYVGGATTEETKYHMQKRREPPLIKYKSRLKRRIRA